MSGRALYWAALTLNTVGLLGFLAWLVYGQQRIFYTQEGILYFLPVLPFFFVYIWLFRPAQPEEDLDD